MINGYGWYIHRNGNEEILRYETCEACQTTLAIEVNKGEYETARVNGYFKIVFNDLRVGNGAGSMRKEGA